VDDSQSGNAPGTWEIPCSFTELFKSETHKLEVPHSASVKASDLDELHNIFFITHNYSFSDCSQGRPQKFFRGGAT